MCQCPVLLLKNRILPLANSKLEFSSEWISVNSDVLTFIKVSLRLLMRIRVTVLSLTSSRSDPQRRTQRTTKCRLWPQGSVSDK